LSSPELVETGWCISGQSFPGHGYEDFVKAMRQVFKSVATRKPDASRDRSPEVYLLGRGVKG